VSEPARASEDGSRLRKLWDEHRARPFPAADTSDPRLQEVALYESWLGTIVDAVLAGGGRVGPAHRALLDARQAEGNQGLWTAAGELGEPARSYLARLMAIEAQLASLPNTEP
jgi:hypothetical protein